MKRIIVPKNTEAEQLLDIAQCPEDQLDELLLENEQFMMLFRANFFHEINIATGSYIDDYEEDAITSPDAIDSAINFINSREWDDEIRCPVRKIVRLLRKAKEYGTSIHFEF